MNESTRRPKLTDVFRTVTPLSSTVMRVSRLLCLSMVPAVLPLHAVNRMAHEAEFAFKYYPQECVSRTWV